jgi:hypothetical protein
MYRGQRQRSKRDSCGRRPNVSAATPRASPLTQVHTLHAQGIPVAVIARALGISRPTVYTYLCRDAPPGPKQPQFQWSAQVLRTVHSLPDPPLAGEQGGQRPALARDSSIGLSPLRPDRLPIHHPAAARRRGRTPPGVAGFTVHPPPGAIGSRSVVRHGVPGRDAVR